MLGGRGVLLGINITLTVALQSGYCYSHPMHENSDAQRVRKLLSFTAIKLQFQVFNPGLWDSKPVSSCLSVPHACCWALTEPKERDGPPHSPPERWRSLRQREDVQPLRKHRQHPEQGPPMPTRSASHVPRRPLQTFPNKAQGSSGRRGSFGLANGVARALESGHSKSHP